MKTILSIFVGVIWAIGAYATCDNDVDMGANKITTTATTFTNNELVTKAYVDNHINVGKTDIFTDSGIHENVPIADVLRTGWSLCYQGTYADRETMDTILNACRQTKLMLSCRRTDSAILQLLAADTRTHVLFDVGNGREAQHTHNSVAWYYSGRKSWGFFPAGESVDRHSCDASSPDATNRLCWHTDADSLTSGHRCGDDVRLNGNVTYERLIFQHP